MSSLHAEVTLSVHSDVCKQTVQRVTEKLFCIYRKCFMAFHHWLYPETIVHSVGEHLFPQLNNTTKILV